MNYEPALGKMIFAIGSMLLSGIILYLFRKIDEEVINIPLKKLSMKWVIYSIIIGIGLWITIDWRGTFASVSLVLLGAYLITCTVTDALICQVYDVMQYCGIFGGVIWLIVQKPEPWIGLSLIFYALLQYLVLIRMYGKADGMGYCICSLYLAGADVDIEGYLYHMMVSFCLLAVVQCIRGNISKKGNLKKAVALYPYISIGFLTMWIFLF